MTRRMLKEEKELRIEVKRMVQVYGKNRLWRGLELAKVGTLITALVRAVREDCVDAYCEAEQREGRRGLNTIAAAIRRKL